MTRGSRLSCFFLLAIVFLLCFSASAFAASFSSPQPAPDAVVTAGSFAVSLGFADSVAVNSAQVVYGGTTASAYITYAQLPTGHWEDDGWESYFVYDLDYTRGTVNASAYGLRNGPQDLTIRITNANGVVSSYTWRVNVSVPPSVSSVQPSANMTVTTMLPIVRANLAANATIVTSTVTLDIDGAVVPATFANNIVSYSVVTPLPPGAHTAHVRFADVDGMVAEKTWTFKIAIAGKSSVSEIAPASLSVVTTGVPTLSFVVTDTLDLNRYASVYVDGRVGAPVWGNYAVVGYNTGYDEEYGYWSTPIYDTKKCTFTYKTPLLADGPHEIAVITRNTNGAETLTRWRFTVNAPAVVTGTQPSSGGYGLVARPTIVVNVLENDPAAPTAVMTIDGTPLSATWDASGKRFVATPGWDLTDRADHAVAIRVVDAVGCATDYAWTFHETAYPVEMWDPRPADGSTYYGCAPRLSVQARDTHPFTSTVMGVDGAAVAVKLMDRTPGYWDWDPEGYDTWFVPTGDPAEEAWFQPAKLGDGPHSVVVTATTARGKTTRYEWSFSVVGTPTIDTLAPAPKSEVANKRPTISAKVADNSGISRYEMVVDGAVVKTSPDSYPLDGVISYTPSADLHDDSSHDVTMTVWDRAGNSAVAHWSFVVQVYPDMPGLESCKDCHADVLQVHPMRNCGACHPGQPEGPCGGDSDCHGAWTHTTDYINGVTFTMRTHGGNTTFHARSCKDCHEPFVEGGIGHPTDTHLTKTTFTGCDDCHVRLLTREHYRYKDASGATFTCDTCHKSSRTDVQAAIAEGDTDCAGCHGAGHEAKHTNTGIDVKCQSCHEDSLTRIHAGVGCAACHSSTDGSVVWAIFAGERRCTACHLSAHGLGLTSLADSLPRPDGFAWSPAIDASLWEGEAALPLPYAQGRRMLSDRRHVAVGDMWAFYRDAMAAKGWNLASPAPAADATSFAVTFEKNEHAVLVRCYDTELPTGGPTATTGYRIDLLYR